MNALILLALACGAPLDPMDPAKLPTVGALRAAGSIPTTGRIKFWKKTANAWEITTYIPVDRIDWTKTTDDLHVEHAS